MYVYIIVIILLLVIELMYFQVAKKFNIIDKPNIRSSHTELTLRGGGIIFYFGVVAFFVVSGFQYPWFFLGCSILAFVSFLDDIFTLSNKIRLLIQFFSVFLLTYQIGVISLPWYYLLIIFVFIVGIINAYNFMDGINGITVSYSISITLLLIYMNNKIEFVNKDLLIYTLIGLIIFAYFNFRYLAKTFAGDVGSVTISYILVFAIVGLIMKTNNLIFILFLSVYGIDSILTIIRRLLLNQNIFEAHRSHLYQYLSNEAKMNKLVVSFVYGATQFLIGFLTIFISSFNNTIQIIFTIFILTILILIYYFLKNYLIKKYQIA